MAFSPFVGSITPPRAPELRARGSRRVCGGGRAPRGVPGTRCGSEEGLGRGEKPGHEDEGAAHFLVAGGRSLDVADVPVREGGHQRPLPGDARMREVASGGDLPRRIHDLRYAPVKTTRKSFDALRQTFFEGLGFEGGDGHSLPVDRVETAKSVAGHEVSVRDFIHALVSSSHVRGEVVFRRFSEGSASFMTAWMSGAGRFWAKAMKPASSVGARSPRKPR